MATDFGYPLSPRFAIHPRPFDRLLATALEIFSCLTAAGREMLTYFTPLRSNRRPHPIGGIPQGQNAVSRDKSCAPGGEHHLANLAE
jgi:hypothetical protein